MFADLSIAEATQRYVVSESTLRRRIKAGELASTTVKRDGRPVTMLAELDLVARWFLRDYQDVDAAFLERVEEIEQFDEVFVGETAKEQWARSIELPDGEPVPVTVVANIPRDITVAAAGGIASAMAVTFFGFLKGAVSESKNDSESNNPRRRPFRRQREIEYGARQRRQIGTVKKLATTSDGIIYVETKDVFYSRSAVEVQSTALRLGERVSLRVINTLFGSYAVAIRRNG